MKITVIGASGFLGSSFVQFFRNKCDEIIEFNKHNEIDLQKDYGFVLYCAGVTFGFRERPFDVIEAHVSKLGQWLQKAKFQKLIYLSSTRIYQNNLSGSESQSELLVDLTDVYNQTKILGETLCQYCEKTLIVRLSNVLDFCPASPYFFWNFLRMYTKDEGICLEETADAGRDYICLEDVFHVTEALIGSANSNGVWNFASGFKVSNREIVDIFESIFGKKEVLFGYKSNHFPNVDNRKILQRINADLLDP